MSKLFTLKEWLTVTESARHLSRLFNEKVAESDVLRLALDGRLKLSVHFVNHAKANPGAVVGECKIEWRELPPIEDGGKPIKYKDGLHINGDKWVKLEDKVVSLEGVWDLPMIGAEHLDVEHEYQRLTNGPGVTLFNIGGVFVEGDNGIICRICEHYDDNEYQDGSSAQLERMENYIVNEKIEKEEADALREIHKIKRKTFNDRMSSLPKHERYYPAASLPKDGVLVVRAKNLAFFISSINKTNATDTLEDGAHSTKLLSLLLEGARQWWGSYDPANPSTAPKNEQVTAWFKEKGAADRVAEVMAQILRADGLPTGPRKSGAK